ncbi:MAG TPA: class I SAM-dependent methyltransferase [Puia sp.]|jgi:SAM-dependent methyltransferase
MRFLPYLRYFFYIAWHWNPILALFTIYYELKGEKKYHIHTIGEDELNSLKERGIDISHAHIYMPVNYFVLERLMNEIAHYDHNKTFLDLGCGKGRVMIVAAEFGFEEITGIDLSKEFCEEAEAATAAYIRKNERMRFTVINGDALYFEIPGDIGTIFLFNPFDEVILEGVVSNILKSQQLSPRTIRVLYANPQHESVLLDHGFVLIYHLKKWNYFEGVILEKKAGDLPAGRIPTPLLSPG